MKKILSFLKKNLSKELILILIPLFFNNAILAYTNYNQYSNKREKIALREKHIEVSNLKRKIELQSQSVNMQLTFNKNISKILKNMTGRLEFTSNLINKYRKKDIQFDSTKIYIDSIENINKQQIMDIGKLNAYSYLNDDKNMGEYEIYSKIINSEYKISKNLLKYLEGKNINHDSLKKDIDIYLMNNETLYTFSTDNLKIDPGSNVNDDDTTANSEAIKNLTHDVSELGKIYKTNRIFSVFAFSICLSISFILIFLSIKFKYFKK